MGTVLRLGELKLDESATRFSRDFKIAAVKRILQGENISALARELGVRRKYLYLWKKRFRTGGADALRGRGRPPRAGPHQPPAAVDQASDALVKAQQRIAELEGKIGRQQVELDFFQQALRHIKGARRPNGAPGAAASTRSSKR